MSAYDSDSSGAEGSEYTETNVLLGYATKEASDDTISQLGGRPTWLDSSSPPSATLAKCKVCNEPMVLLLQLDGNLPEFFPGHERRLYVFSCRSSKCRRKDGSVRAIRGVRVSEVVVKEKREDPKPESTEAAKKPMRLGDMLFGAKPSNISPTTPAATTNTSTSNSKPTENFPPLPNQSTPEAAPKAPISYTSLNKTFASTSLNGPPPPPEPWPTEERLPKPYPRYYIGDADYETLDKEPPPIPQATQVMDYEIESSSSTSKEDKNAYEDSGDVAFLKFADRLDQNPEQVIRYEFRGQPLLYSKTDAVGKMFHNHNGKIATSSGSGSSNRVPRCENCGAQRVFEVQLCPHAIFELEAEEEGVDGMEWTVVAVAVCGGDCLPKGVGMGEVGYVEEAALVQWEIPKSK